MKMRKAAAAVMAVLLVNLFTPGLCAFAMGERLFGVESEADFLKWYEEHKDSGGEFTLKGALRLSSGTAGQPVVFDGEGEIRINCARFSIDVISPVVFDNPNLTIVNDKGFSTVAICDRDASLALFQGNIVNTGGGIGVEFMEGCVITEKKPEKEPDHGAGGPNGDNEYASPSNASPSNAASPDIDPVGKGSSNAEGADAGFRHEKALKAAYASEKSPFYITVTSKEETDDEACGIKFLGEGDVALSGLFIEVSGADSYGIQSQSAGVTIEASRIVSEGRGIAYGIWSEGDVSASSSVITVKGSVGAALHSRSGETYIDGCSVLQPETDLKSRYLVSDQPEILVPLAIKVSSELEELEFPKSAEVILKELGGGGWRTEEILVKEWNLENFVLDKAGKVTVEGILDEASLALAEASNPSGMPVKQDVVKLGNTGTYISDLEYKPGNGITSSGTSLFLWCPYPYGADCLYAEYSRDGGQWSAVEYDEGESNWMEDYFSAPNESHQFLLTFDIPYEDGEFLLRLRTVGGGAYEGTGNPVTVNLDKGEVSGLYDPGSADDGNSGDRGGTTVDPDLPLPDDKEEPADGPKDETVDKPKDETENKPKDETTDNPGTNGGAQGGANGNSAGNSSHEDEEDGDDAREGQKTRQKQPAETASAYETAVLAVISDSALEDTIMAQSGQTGKTTGEMPSEIRETGAAGNADAVDSMDAEYIAQNGGGEKTQAVESGEPSAAQEPLMQDGGENAGQEAVLQASASGTKLPIAKGVAAAAVVLAAAFGSFWFIGKLSGKLK